MASIFTWAYAIPVTLIFIFYSKLFGKVREHSAMLAAQAKKMNMKSLQSNADADKESAEIKIAKIAFTIFFLFIVAWTPYAVVAFIGAFGNRCGGCVLSGTRGSKPPPHGDSSRRGLTMWPRGRVPGISLRPQ